MNTRLFRLTLALLFLSAGPVSTHAGPFSEVAYTNENSLNDLIGRVAFLPLPDGKDLRRLSAIQEQLVLYERDMRGEGLPEGLAKAFSIHYSAVIAALVDDRIDDEYGRDLLSVHRQLLARTRQWACHPGRDEDFAKEVVKNLLYFVRELDEESLEPHEVPPGIRTPVINGYQVWLGELLAWGCETGAILAYDARVLQVKLDVLEQRECAFKRDGVLYPRELDLLHERFLELTQETIERVAAY